MTSPLAAPAIFPIQQMLSAAAYPHPVSRLELRETHLSWIVLTGPYAYKIRKPVRFDFVDQSSFEHRRELCEEELRLNSRLAPELYLEVVRLCQVPSGLKVGGQGPTIEHAVKMLQFDNSEELPARLHRNAVQSDDMRQFGALLAGFHGAAAIAAPQTPYGSVMAVSATVLGNLASLAREIGSPGHSPDLDRLTSWTHEEFRCRESLIAGRKAAGFVRECHGDLHGRNIVWWRGRLVPFDALEFDPGLRWIDVIDDIAFIVMDLLSYQRDDLAFTLLSAWLEASGDYDALMLLRLYAVYRALVRAKVDALQLHGPTRGAPGDAARMRFMKRIEVADRIARPARPALILMHGVSGSGKSWVSERLIENLGVVRARSDLERKRLTGLSSGIRSASPVGGGLYSAAMSERTYEQLLRCAKAAINGGIGIVVDAAFLAPSQRQMFRDLARSNGCAFLVLSCQADLGLLTRRLAQRAAAGHDPSEADTAVLRHQLTTSWQLAAEEARDAIEIPTTEPDTLAKFLPQISARLALAPGH